VERLRWNEQPSVSLGLEKIGCLVVTSNLSIPNDFLAAAEAAHLPLLSTPLSSAIVVSLITGLGILNIRELFGVSSFVEEKNIYRRQ
jgi:serine kinase of HPr protein (carbohydrate metabolism regulator)